MPYSVKNLTLNPSQPLSQSLGHRPFFALPYDLFDGIFAGNTDTIYLSVGLAQYDQNDVSVKSMRFVNNQWSPQAEEVPVHRAVDMAILVAKTVFDENKSTVDFSTGVFQGQESAISLSKEPRNSSEQTTFNNFKSKHGHVVRDRLNALADVLNDLRRRGCI